MSYGVSETSAIRITRVIEDTLIRSGKFNLQNNFLIEMKWGEFKHEVRQFEKSYDNQQAEQISLMV